MGMINTGARLLAIIALSTLIDLSVSVMETDSYYHQAKNIIPKITNNNIGITCEKHRSYTFKYLLNAGRLAITTKNFQSNFPLRFGAFKYEIEGPYYLYPIYIGGNYYNGGSIGEDFVVFGSHGFVLGGVTVRLIYNQLNYFPCLPQKTNTRLDQDQPILSALKAAVDNPGLRSGESETVGEVDKLEWRSGESKTVGAIDDPKKELVVTEDEAEPQGWNPFMQMKYWKLDGWEFPN